MRVPTRSYFSRRIFIRISLLGLHRSRKNSSFPPNSPPFFRPFESKIIVIEGLHSFHCFAIVNSLDRHRWGTIRRGTEARWGRRPFNTTPAARVERLRFTSTRCPDSSSPSPSSSWTSSTGAPSCREDRGSRKKRRRKRRRIVSNGVFFSFEIIFVNPRWLKLIVATKIVEQSLFENKIEKD